MKYKITKCHSCNSEKVNCIYIEKEFGLFYNEIPEMWMCDICANINIRKVVRHPTSYPNGTPEILKSIAFCTNLILKELKN